MKVRLNYTKWQIILQIVVFFLLLAAVFAALKLALTKQEIRKKASSTEMTLTLYPTNETFNVGEVKSFDLKATFTGGSGSEKIDYFKTVISFPEQLKIPDDPQYAIILPSGLKRIIQVDDPQTANAKGKIQIELGAERANEGPPTNQTYTVFRIYFQATAGTTTPSNISLESIQVVNNLSSEMSTTANGASVTVNDVRPTITPPPSGYCTSDDQCPDTERCDSDNKCTQVICVMGAPVCQQIVVRNHRCELDNLPDGTSCTDEDGNAGSCQEGACVISALTPTCPPPVCPPPPIDSGCYYEGQDSCSCGILVCPTPSNTPFPSQPPSITPTPIPSCQKDKGDANCDGIIDGVDYSIWLNSQCPPTRPTNAVCGDYSADFNNDGNVDDSDLAIWMQNRI
jgi:hypothetical protein